MKIKKFDDKWKIPENFPLQAATCSAYSRAHEHSWN
jgi:hypothetical protein